jgi:hypothetical protein
MTMNQPAMPRKGYYLDGTTIKRTAVKIPSNRDFHREFAGVRKYIMDIMKFRGNRPNYIVAGSI